MKKSFFFIMLGATAWLNTAEAQTITGNALNGSLGGARILSTQGNTAANPAIGFTGSTALSSPIGTGAQLNDGAGGNGIFRPAANVMAFATSGVERMRFTPSGNVGIGTTNPLAKVQIEGIALPNTTQIPTLLVKASNSVAAQFLTDGGGTVEIADPCGSTGMIMKKGTGRGDVRFTESSLQFTASAANQGCVQANTYGMELTTDGKLVIGDAINSSNVYVPGLVTSEYKLYVQTGILTEKVKVATKGTWADYVFASNYSLKPLEEVEAYIKIHKHLPNVPSADELDKNGLDLGAMQAKQMEKIEELTLYMIEMKKEIDLLKKENAELKLSSSPSKH